MDTQVTGISVLVCTYNGGQKLTETLRHLHAQRVETAFPWEVLVIDNASTDGTYDRVTEVARDFRGAELTVMQEARPGKTYALESGFLRARYSHVIICDDDNWLAPDYLETAYRIVRDNPALGVLGGTGEAAPEVDPPAWFWRCSKYYALGSQAARNGDVTDSRGWVYGAGMVVNKAVWQKMTAYQYQGALTCRRGAAMSGGEDVELCAVARLLGFRILVDDRLRFRHFIPQNRMTWAYFRKLLTGSASSDAFLRFFAYFTNPAALQTTSLQDLYAAVLKERLGELRRHWRAFVQLAFFGMATGRTDFIQIYSVYTGLKTLVRDKKNIMEQVGQVKRLQQQVHADYVRQHPLACNEG